MQPALYSTASLPVGKAGTVRTLREMAKLALAGAGHPRVIETAHGVVRRVPERDDVATMTALLSEVRRRMRYTRDPLGTELVKAPWVVIDQSNLHGVEPMDCDDASTLLSSMLGAVGIPSRFRVIATDPKRPRDFSHVYVSARTTDGRWIPLDPIVRNFAAGQQVPDERLTRPREDFDVFLGCDSERCQMRGMGDSDFQSFTSSAKDVALRLLDAKYPGSMKQQQAQLPSVMSVPHQGFDFEEWINPYYRGQVNVKAVVVLGVGGFIAWKLLKGRRR